MTYVKTYLPTLKTHVVNLKRDAKDLSCDFQRLEVRDKLGSKTSTNIAWDLFPRAFEADVTSTGDENSTSLQLGFKVHFFFQFCIFNRKVKITRLEDELQL